MYPVLDIKQTVTIGSTFVVFEQFGDLRIFLSGKEDSE